MHRSLTVGLPMKHQNRSTDRIYLIEVLRECLLTGEMGEVPECHFSNHGHILSHVLHINLISIILFCSGYESQE